MRFVFSISVISIIAAFSLSSCLVQAADVERPEAKSQAEQDVTLGMMGIQQAASDPKVLAQLIADMQDPEIMAEAKKMMEDPKFQEQMKDLSKSKKFKDGVKKTKELMDDPNTAAKMMAQAQHMFTVGTDQIKKDSQNVMQEAMASLSDPTVMKEAGKWLKSPEFKQQFAEMQKDPTMKNYIQAVKDMAKDPEHKDKVKALADIIKDEL